MFENFYWLYIFFVNLLLVMIERSCVDIDRGLEVVCSSLIDIEFSVLNGEDIYEIVF